MTNLTKSKNGNGHRLFPSLTDSFFRNRFFGLPLGDIDSDLMETGINAPPANISETKSEFKVDLSAPGLKRDDFKVEVENGELVISAEKEEEKKEETENFTRREFSYNSFRRSFELPENIAEDKINAKYENGMLNISIPKKEPSREKPRKAIKVA